MLCLRIGCGFVFFERVVVLSLAESEFVAASLLFLPYHFHFNISSLVPFASLLNPPPNLSPINRAMYILREECGILFIVRSIAAVTWCYSKTKKARAWPKPAQS
ncbi:hypothetical protein P8452_54363 [Trifolium repens]|nr:hypothetical protein P8452_54363 [Trifolium repens]